MASATVGALPDIPLPTRVQIRRLSRGNVTSFRVPSLPKLHGKGPLTTTRLCDTIHKSTAGHVFDLSKHHEYSSFYTDYNSLHDPHLKAYYCHPSMKQKLITNKFVTPGLRVICSLKEYNAYRNFLEMEFMKLHKRKEEERAQRKTGNQAKRPSLRSTVDHQREEKRKQFFIQQEKNLKMKQLHFKRMKRKEDLAKMKMLEERRMQRERTEMKREAEQERRKLEKMQKEHEEQSTRKRVLKNSEAMDKERMIHLQTMRHAEKMKGLQELDKRWQMYEEHAQRAKREEEERKQKQKEAREKRMRQREKIFQMLQKKEDERRKKTMEENHHEVEVLKEQADKLEQKWQVRKMCEVNEWKDKISKQQECWNDSVKRCQETRKKEHEKHIEELLSSCHPPTCSEPKPLRSRKISSNVSFASSSKTTTHQPTVRFNPTPTVHILEQTLSEEDNEREQAEGEVVAIGGECVEVIELEDDARSIDEEEEEDKGVPLEDSAEMEIATLESIDFDGEDIKESVPENVELKVEADCSAGVEEIIATAEGDDQNVENDDDDDEGCDHPTTSPMPEDVSSASELAILPNDDDAETRSIASSIVSIAIGKALDKVGSSQATVSD